MKALRRAGATSLQDADQVLGHFLPAYNTRFAVPSAQDGSASRPWPAGLRPDTLFCFKHERVVAKDNTISFDGHRLPIAPGRSRRSYAHCTVELRQLLNGQLLVSYQGSPLARFKPLDPGPPAVGMFTPAEPPAISIKPRPDKPISRSRVPGRPHKPAPDHPWRLPIIAQARAKKPEG